MVRFPSAQRASRRPAIGSPLQTSRRMLRRLVDENVTLTRELKELRHLSRLAQRDSSTGLPNRQMFEERLAEELSRARRDPAARGSLIVVDVNDLDVVKDRLGIGVLRDVADVVRTGLRAEDVCCRTGGDEFMILLPDTDARGARIVMARLRVAAIRAGSRRSVAVTISAGASTWPTDGRRGAILIEKAAAAMGAERRRMRRLARRRPQGGGTLCLVK